MVRAKILSFVCMVLLMTVGTFAGTKQDVWVVDDFESYAADPNAFHASSLESPGWWTVQLLEELFMGITPPPGFICQLSLVMGDPNGFMASDEIDADGPMSMQIHYELAEGYSCDAFIFAHNLGLPFEIVETGYPPESGLPTHIASVDLTKYDKISLKMKKLIGNKSTPGGNFTVGFMGTNLGTLGLFAAIQPPSVPIFMEYPEDVWEIYEFVLDSSQFPLDSVAGIAFGTYDDADVMGTGVTYLLDEITFYKDSVPCPLHKGGDMNLDCTVNILDFVILSEDWLSL